MASSAPAHRGTKPRGPRVSVTVTPDQYLALQKLAERNNVSLAWLARYAVDELIETVGDGQLKLPLRRD